MTPAPALAVALAAAFGATASAPARVAITSDSSCPEATMVRAALDALGGSGPGRPAIVSVSVHADGLRLEFQWDGDGPVDVRQLATSADCAERANAAAIVTAAWLGVLPAAPTAAPTAAPPAPAAPLVVARPAPEATPRATPTQWWLGVGLGAGAGGGVAAGARLELARVQSGGHALGWIVAAQGTLPRSRSVGSGTSSWVRPALGAAGTAAWQGSRLSVAGDLGALAGATFAWGSGYPSNATDAALALGLAAGVRLQLTGGPSRAWVELRAVKWLTAQRLLVDSSTTNPLAADLPGIEGFLTLGWSLPVS